jgi:methylmalonyl-CoA mutase N-terminal domain/subunit
MDEASEKKVRSLRLKLAIAEKELQAAGAKWKLGGFLGAGHANAMNREVDKVQARLNEKIEKIKTQIAEITGVTTAPKKAEEKPAAKKAVPVTSKAADTKPAAKPELNKTEKASAKKPAQKSAAKTAKKK